MQHLVKRIQVLRNGSMRKENWLICVDDSAHFSIVEPGIDGAEIVLNYQEVMGTLNEILNIYQQEIIKAGIREEEE